jgi:hypothetical protein
MRLFGSSGSIATHWARSTIVESWLASTQTDAPGGDVKPSAHAAHAVDPAVFVKVLAGHVLHDADPGFAANEPGAHAVQAIAEPPPEKKPGAHG